MKKVGLLIVIAMLASALLAAATPGKLVRLTVINQTGGDVYIKLEGNITGSFYYLTNKPGVNYWTVLADVYSRTTWACGYQDSGALYMTSNVRLNFVPCDRVPTRWVWDWLYGMYIKQPNFGEPTMEKVFYYTGYSRWFWSKGSFWYFDPVLGPIFWNWAWIGLTNWAYLPGSVRNRVYSGPVGIYFRYQ